MNLFIESNPAPAKFVAEALGLCSGDVRLPLTRLSEENQPVLRATANSMLVCKGREAMSSKSGGRKKNSRRYADS